MYHKRTHVYNLTYMISFNTNIHSRTPLYIYIQPHIRFPYILTSHHSTYVYICTVPHVSFGPCMHAYILYILSYIWLPAGCTMACIYIHKDRIMHAYCHSLVQTQSGSQCILTPRYYDMPHQLHDSYLAKFPTHQENIKHRKIRPSHAVTFNKIIPVQSSTRLLTYEKNAAAAAAKHQQLIPSDAPASAAMAKGDAACSCCR